MSNTTTTTKQIIRRHFGPLKIFVGCDLSIEAPERGDLDDEDYQAEIEMAFEIAAETIKPHTIVAGNDGEAIVLRGESLVEGSVDWRTEDCYPILDPDEG